jgi:hypothetical protein
MILTVVSCAAYAETSVNGLPFEPNHGRSVTAAEMILEDPRALRNWVKKLRRLAASDGECGLPAPSALGYSLIRYDPSQGAFELHNNCIFPTQSISIPWYERSILKAVRIQEKRSLPSSPKVLTALMQAFTNVVLLAEELTAWEKNVLPPQPPVYADK